MPPNHTTVDNIGGESFEDPYLTDCFDYIHNLGDDLDLPANVENTAKETVQTVPPRIRQHYKPCFMAAAALQIESRKASSSSPRTVKQVAISLAEILGSEDHLSKKTDFLKKTRRTVKKLKQTQGLDLDPELAENFLPYILDEFNVDQDTRKRAWQILKDVSGSQELQSKSQIGIASAIAYLAARKTDAEVPVEELADLSCRTKKTIRDSAQLIQNQLMDQSSEG